MSKPKTTRYTPEQKAQVLKMLAAPDANILDISGKTGVSVPTLYTWRKEVQEAAGREEVRHEKGEEKTNHPVYDNVGLEKRVRLLEAELARKNEIIAELSVLVLQNHGLLKGKK
ncbi:transposase [Myxococcus sp. K15C18031901]|uniref:transposase n=1 Tax=Myxococcus dinghuensis TaxID=2906761 RepID=UPI0020A743FC|nr:transposase [Myxococcus dinghuensis]MCP3103537.1 transposase [Myxococcus dinghuensis]